jgi:hypothetical protein
MQRLRQVLGTPVPDDVLVELAEEGRGWQLACRLAGKASPIRLEGYRYQLHQSLARTTIDRGAPSARRAAAQLLDLGRRGGPLRRRAWEIERDDANPASISFDAPAGRDAYLAAVREAT